MERKLSIDSVDTQIDTYIIEFEDKALKIKPVKDAADAEGAPPEADVPVEEGALLSVGDILKENIKFLLEADDENQDNEEDGSSIFDETDKDTGDKEKTQLKINVNSPPEPNREPANLDVDTFAANIARLMNHTENLLSVKKVVYNRAMKFIEENYDEDTKSMVEMSIKTNFDVDVKTEDEEFDSYEKTSIEREY